MHQQVYFAQYVISRTETPYRTLHSGLIFRPTLGDEVTTHYHGRYMVAYVHSLSVQYARREAEFIRKAATASTAGKSHLIQTELRASDAQ